MVPLKVLFGEINKNVGRLQISVEMAGFLYFVEGLEEVREGLDKFPSNRLSVFFVQV